MFRQTIISSNLLKANFHLSKQSPRLIPGQNGEGPLFLPKGQNKTEKWQVCTKSYYNKGILYHFRKGHTIMCATIAPAYNMLWSLISQTLDSFKNKIKETY